MVSLDNIVSFVEDATNAALGCLSKLGAIKKQAQFHRFHSPHIIVWCTVQYGTVRCVPPMVWFNFLLREAVKPPTVCASFSTHRREQRHAR